METLVQKAWLKSKLLVKAMVIGIIILVLMIPSSYVEHLIGERETRQKEAIAEVSSKWAGRQTITGPLIVLPFWQPTGDTNKVPVKHLAYFLPDNLTIASKLVPEEKYRGIYKVLLYSSTSKISGSFNAVDLGVLKISPQNVLWNEAYVQVAITDSKGLNEELNLTWNNQTLHLNPDVNASGEAMTAPLNLTNVDDLKKVDFSIDMNLSGSEELRYTPVGKSTTVRLSSTWPHPSFTGDILPQATTINDSGFNATWKSLAHKRDFPQQWKDDAYSLVPQPAGNNSSQVSIQKSAFGSALFVPVNGYQKTTRSIKYSILCIVLSFAAFFLIETTNKKSVHPFQYGLIGLALILFYTLLLSFSEYTGFNIAYCIASIATIGLIAWFVKGLLSSSRLSVILSMVLLLTYSYIFTILQLQDYSLILGSVGLFVTLAVIMHFSKRIQW